MGFKRGARFKHKNIPIICELNAIGYTAHNIHRLLECSKGYGYELLVNPERLKLGQLKNICFALNKPLGYVLNSLLCIPARSGNWLDEDYSPIDKIRELKG